jgi:hypothetical protein
MDSKTKRHITEEWLKAFPDLSAYSQNKLYKTIGAFICGVELINLPRSENYRPHFVIYTLFKKDIKSCLEYPALVFEFFDDKKLQLDLPYNDISGHYIAAQNLISQNLKIPFDKNVSLQQFNELINNVILNDPIYKSHPGKIASLLELKFYAALYVGDKIQAEKILNQIQFESKTWNMQLFETWYGKFDMWIKELQKTIFNRELFLKQIEENRNDKKIIQLKNSELTT